MDYDGEFALWEVRAAVEQALDWVSHQIMQEYELDEQEEDE